MLRRFFTVTVALLLSTVIAFAGSLPHVVIEDGNSVLRTFKLTGQPPDVVDYFRECLESPRNVVLFSANGIWDYALFVVPPNCNLTLRNSLTPGFIRFDTSPTTEFRLLTFNRDPDSGDFTLSGDDLCYGADKVRYVAAGHYWNTVNYSFPSLAYNYIADVQGSLLIEWDLQDGGGSSDGILGWLGDFWQKFINTVKGLFVPRDGYFTDFFDEIKTAFEKKLGGLGDLLGSISDMFESLKSASKESSLVIKIPDDQFFKGYKGITVDVLKPIKPLLSFLRGLFNAILIVFTVILCYRKLNEIVDT